MRNVAWLATIALIAAAMAGVVWLRVVTGQRAGDKTVSLGEPLRSFQLPDLVHNRTFSLADDLGKREVVIVSYMGWF